MDELTTREKNRAKYKAQACLYKKTYRGKKSHKISEWKSKSKVKETPERFDYIFDRWYKTENCDLCYVKLEGKQKNMEHHHSSGHFRNITCIRCNNHIARTETRLLKVLLEMHRFFLTKEK